MTPVLPGIVIRVDCSNFFFTPDSLVLMLFGAIAFTSSLTCNLFESKELCTEPSLHCMPLLKDFKA